MLGRGTKTTTRHRSYFCYKNASLRLDRKEDDSKLQPSLLSTCK